MKKRRLFQSVFILILIGLGSLPILAVIYFFSLGYDTPFRLQGHYEKNLYLMDRRFALSPDGATLVYANLSTGHGDLYTMNIDGRATRRLTSASEYESGPCFSPDGRWILFCRETNMCGHIWRIALNGTGARQLTFGPDYDSNPLYSNDGSQIWFERVPLGTSPGGRCQMFTMTAEGQNVAPFDPINPEFGSAIAVCSANQSVYYTGADYSNPDAASFRQIWQMQANGSGKHQIVAGLFPAVCRKGDRIAYVTGPADNEVWISKPDGAQPRRVYTSNGNKRWLSFSSDGKQVFFSEETSRADYLSSVRVDGSEYHRICELITSYK